MSKKVMNRYTILEVTEQVIERIQGNRFVEEFFNYVDKYNKYQPNPYFLGNIKILEEKGIIVYTKYKKIANPSTLEKIDNLTSLYTEEEIKKLYSDKTIGNKPFVIGYKANRKLRTLQIIYKENKKYLNRTYIKESIIKYANNLEFLNFIINNEQIKKSIHSSAEKFESLNTLRSELLMDIESPRTELLTSFYNAFIMEGGKFNYFNMRLIGIIIKTFEEKYTYEDTMLNGLPVQIKISELKEAEVPGQTIIFEFNKQALKAELEELKQQLTEGNYVDRENSLKLTHETTK